MPWLHPNKQMEILKSKIDKIANNTMGASDGQILFRRTFGDADTSWTGVLLQT
jgi:hypothetical protein